MCTKRNTIILTPKNTTITTTTTILQITFSFFSMMMLMSKVASIFAVVATTSKAFVLPGAQSRNSRHWLATEISSAQDAAVSTGKPTGTSFLPEETIERAKKGNPTEKAKLEKDPVNAWIDVYEYARKIREGEMTWEEVETADLDTVRLIQTDKKCQ
jgi:hypothetical protein